MLFNQLMANALVHVQGDAAVSIGDIVVNIWNQTYGIIKAVGTPLATATLAFSAFYFFFIGRDKDYLAKAKKMMIDSLVGLLIIYAAVPIINWFVDIAKTVASAK
jgi:hypothetical protein